MSKYCIYSNVNSGGYYLGTYGVQGGIFYAFDSRPFDYSRVKIWKTKNGAERALNKLLKYELPVSEDSLSVKEVDFRSEVE